MGHHILWNLGETQPATAWSGEIDQLMQQTDDYVGLCEAQATLRSRAIF
jgi:hypothetical protein